MADKSQNTNNNPHPNKDLCNKQLKYSFIKADVSSTVQNFSFRLHSRFMNDEFKSCSKLERLRKDLAERQVELNLIEEQVAKAIAEDRSNWPEWSDSELVCRFENGDINYEDVANSAFLRCKLETAYSKVKSELKDLTVVRIRDVAVAVLSLNKDVKDSDQGYWICHYVKRACAAVAKENPDTIDNFSGNHNSSVCSSSRKRPRTQVELDKQDISDEENGLRPCRQKLLGNQTDNPVSATSTSTDEQEVAIGRAEQEKTRGVGRNNPQKSTSSSANQNIERRSGRQAALGRPGNSAITGEENRAQSSGQQVSENLTTRASLSKATSLEAQEGGIGSAEEDDAESVDVDKQPQHAREVAGFKKTIKRLLCEDTSGERGQGKRAHLLQDAIDNSHYKGKVFYRELSRILKQSLDDNKQKGQSPEFRTAILHLNYFTLDRVYKNRLRLRASRKPYFTSTDAEAGAKTPLQVRDMPVPATLALLRRLGMRYSRCGLFEEGMAESAEFPEFDDEDVTH
ncbi:hypothetical protein B0J14DRAFT_704640 [Halenospora varia]|nr:hypothetical protein B0J14DRAFT_704640 [Halenospora varia]